jgi:hypothetical protein
MSEENLDPKRNGRVRGRPFKKGNGGRRPGSKNRTTLVAEALFKGEEEALVRKAIALAKAGDVQMLKFLLDRILPKERSVHVELPGMERADDAVDALGAIINAVGTGQIAPSEGSAIASLVVARTHIMNETELKSRLDDIEKRQKKIQYIVEHVLGKSDGSNIISAHSER